MEDRHYLFPAVREALNKAYKEIASELRITSNTVGTYVRGFYEKLHVRSRREIVVFYKGRAESSASG